MKKGLFCVLVCILMILSIIIPVSGIEVSEKTSKSLIAGNILYVGGSGPGNYSTIQEAVNSASDGDTIFVYTGMYVENVNMNKSIILKGEEKHTTIVDGGGFSVFTVTVDYVTIQDFTIRNGGYEHMYSAIIILHSNYVTIHNTILQTSKWGLYVLTSCNNTFSDNIIETCDYPIRLYSYSNNNIITNNTCSNGAADGIGLFSGSNYNIVTHNYLHNNSIGIPLTSYNRVENNIILYCNSGMQVVSGCYNVIQNNTLEQITDIAFDMRGATNISITNNTVTDCNIGLSLTSSASYNSIRENIFNCTNQVWINIGSVNNQIYYNSFLDSDEATDLGENSWDTGYPSGGNYWASESIPDDFHGPNQDIDGPDGIGDTSKIITGDNRDHYPLMYHYHQDIEPPIVRFSAPLMNTLYLVNLPFLKLPSSIYTIIVGRMTIIVFAEDNISGINRIDLLIDGTLVWHVNQVNPEYQWLDRTFSKHQLDVIAYDVAGNNASCNVTVWKFF